MALIKQKALQSMTWWVGVGFFGLASAAYVIADEYGPGGMMPQMLAISIMALAAIHTVAGLIMGVVADDEEWHDLGERRAYPRRRLGFLAMAAAVGFGAWLVGFHITLPVFLLLFIGLVTGRWVLGALMGGMIWFFTYLVLAQTLHVAFPATVLQRWMIANGWF